LPNPATPPPGERDATARARREAELACWRDALHLLPLAEEVSASPGTHLRVLFQPTFHAPGCLTLHLQERVSTIELILPGPATREWVRQAIGRRDQSPLPPPPGDLAWTAAPVPVPVRDQFGAALAGIALAGLGDTRPHAGRDGLLIDGEVAEEGVAGTFAAWSPTAVDAPAVYQVCRALLALGRACLSDEQSRTVLSQIERYLHPR
jgi:hypothetical protein